MAHDNRLLGVFQLGNIPPAARGVPKIEVTFDIDANGILNVAAKDTATNNEQKITITSSSGLSKDEVDKMAKDAESHAADDRKLRDTIEANNKADAMVYNVEKTLTEHRGQDRRGRREGDRICPRRDQDGHWRRGSRPDQRRHRPAHGRQPEAGRSYVQIRVRASRRPHAAERRRSRQE